MSESESWKGWGWGDQAPEVGLGREEGGGWHPGLGGKALAGSGPKEERGGRGLWGGLHGWDTWSCCSEHEFFAVLSLTLLILEMELRGSGTASEGYLT